ncbi:catalytic domain of Map kinase phosphatase 5, partial [Cantharellus anzutake]
LSRIAPGLYLGNSTAAEDTRLLQSLGITHVLNVTEELPMVEWAPSMRITLADMAHANLLDTFEDALGFIDLALGDQRDVKAFTNARGILVHCLMGRSRSASIIIAYIMRKYKLNYRAAHTYVHSKRPIIWPNLGFVNQLNLW